MIAFQDSLTITGSRNASQLGCEPRCIVSRYGCRDKRSHWSVAYSAIVGQQRIIYTEYPFGLQAGPFQARKKSQLLPIQRRFQKGALSRGYSDCDSPTIKMRLMLSAILFSDTITSLRQRLNCTSAYGENTISNQAVQC
jgi:hypothetical protein